MNTDLDKVYTINYTRNGTKNNNKYIGHDGYPELQSDFTKQKDLNEKIFGNVNEDREIISS